MTLDRAVINLANVSSAGLTFVAISRVKVPAFIFILCKFYTEFSKLILCS